MSVAFWATDRKGPPRPCLQFDPRCYSDSIPDGENCNKHCENCKEKEQVEWKVEVAPAGHVITRKVCRNGAPWNQCGSTSEQDGCDALTKDLVIWPAWPARSEDEAASSPSPLADVQKHWQTAGNRLRDSAKWSAAALGAALATVIGTSPLARMKEPRDHTSPPIAIPLLGGAGLIFLGITMFLILQVMRPREVSFTHVQQARKRWWWLPRTALWKWKTTIQSQQDLYLPCGVKSLTGLRQSMIIEEMTLVALSRATATAPDPASRQELCKAQAARAVRLQELRAAAAMVATVGEYYTLRYRSSWATYGGILCGLLGAAAIVTAFVWPWH